MSKETRQLLKLEPTLEIAKKEFLQQTGEFKAGLEAFNLTYENYLTKLEKELQEKGELEQLLLFRKEKAEFRKGVQAGEVQFVKLQQLQNIYGKEREARREQIANDLQPILTAYLDELAGIQKKLTKADKIDEALAVKKEEDRVKVLFGDPKAAVFALGIFPDPVKTTVAGKAAEPEKKEMGEKEGMKALEERLVGQTWRDIRDITYRFEKRGRVASQIAGEGETEGHWEWEVVEENVVELKGLLAAHVLRFTFTSETEGEKKWFQDGKFKATTTITLVK